MFPLAVEVLGEGDEGVVAECADEFGGACCWDWDEGVVRVEASPCGLVFFDESDAVFGLPCVLEEAASVVDAAVDGVGVWELVVVGC